MGGSRHAESQYAPVSFCRNRGAQQGAGSAISVIYVHSSPFLSDVQESRDTDISSDSSSGTTHFEASFFRPRSLLRRRRPLKNTLVPFLQPAEDLAVHALLSVEPPLEHPHPLQASLQIVLAGTCPPTSSDLSMAQQFCLGLRLSDFPYRRPFAF